MYRSNVPASRDMYEFHDLSLLLADENDISLEYHIDGSILNLPVYTAYVWIPTSMKVKIRL